MADRRVRLILEAQADQFKRSMDEAARSTDGVRQSAEQLTRTPMKDHVRDIGREWTTASRTMQSDMRTVGTGFAAMGASITGVYGALVSTGVEYNSLQQTAGNALETMTGSASAAADQMDRLDDFASTSPFFRQTWIQAQQQLMAFGMEADRVVPTLQGVEEAVAAVGGGDAEIMRLVDILGQIEGQGQITGRELQRLGQMGINAADLIGDAMGVSGEQIRTQITAGALDAETAIDALTTGMVMNFEGSAEGMRDTMSGAWADLQAAWRDLGSTLAEPLVSTDGGGFLVDLTNNAADFIRTIDGMDDQVVRVVGAIGGISGVAMAGYGAMMLLVPQMVAFHDAKKRLNTVMPTFSRALRGIGWAGAAAGAVVLADALLRLGDTEYDVSRMALNVERDMKRIGDSGANAQTGFDHLETNRSAWWQNGMEMSINGIGDAMTMLDESAGHFASRGPELFGWNNWAVDANAATAAFESTDQAVANLIASGNIEAAAAQLLVYAEDAQAADWSTTKLGEHLPDTVDELLRMGNSGELTAGQLELLDEALNAVGEGDGVITGFLSRARDHLSDLAYEAEHGAPPLEGFSDAMAEVGLAADGTVESVKKFMDHLLEAGLVTQSAMEAEMAFESQLRSVDEAVQALTDSIAEEYEQKGYSAERARELAEESVELGHALDDTGKQFDFTTEAGEAAAEAFFGVADRGRNMAQAMADSDASLDEVQGALERTQESLINTGVEFGMTEEDAKALANEVLGIPDDATIESWMDDEAISTAKELAEALDAVDGRSTSSSHTHTVHQNTVRRMSNSGLDPNLHNIPMATGGAVRGPGGPTDDLVPIAGSNGEHMLTARDVQAMGGQDAVYSFRRDLHGGGPSASSMVSTYQPGQARQARELAAAVSGGGGGAYEASLVGAQVEIGPDGLGRFVDGRVKVSMKDPGVIRAASQGLQREAYNRSRAG